MTEQLPFPTDSDPEPEPEQASDGLTPRTLQTDRPLSFFDLETTGVDETARIVQIAICTYSPDTGEWVEFESLVNPEMPIPPGSTAVHGITDQDVADAPTLEAIADRILAELPADLCGFNALKFDVPILARELDRVGRPLDLTGRRIIDPFLIFLQREPRNLSAALKLYCNRDHEGAHDAMADVRATIDVLAGQLAHYDDLPDDVQLLHETCVPAGAVDVLGKLMRDEEGRICVAFGKHRGVPLSEVDPGYLRWMLDKDFPADTKAIIREEMAR